MVAESNKMTPEDKDDLTQVMWNDKGFLQRFALNEENVMLYFSLSQFYDKNCNNEIIKMQRLDPALLQTMPGIEYKLSGNPVPGLFIITKSQRTINPPKLEPLATYYVHDGNVYQAPSIHALLSSRMLQSLHHLRGAFETMQNSVDFSGQGKYVWNPPPIALDNRGEKETDSTAIVSRAERQAVDRMLYDILEKNRQINAAHEQKHNPQPDQAPPDGSEPTGTAAPPSKP